MSNATLTAQLNCPTTTDSITYLKTFLPLIYGVPTLVLNVFLIRTILKDKSLHRIFFFQFIVFATGNSLYWISSLLFDRILLFPEFCPLFVKLFTQPHILLKMVYFAYCYGVDNYFYSVLTIITWRVIVIFRTPYNENVNPTFLKVLLLIQYLLPFTFFWIYFNTDALYGFSRPGVSRILFFAAGWPYISAAGVSGIKFCVLAILILLSSICMIYRIVRIRKREDRKAERNIIITSLTFGLSAISISFYQTAIYYYLMIVNDVIMTGVVASNRGFVIDVAALLPSWSLLITSDRVRHNIFNKKTSPSAATSQQNP